MVARKTTAALKLGDYYVGRDKQHRDELTPELRSNARDIVDRINQLLRCAGIPAQISSGWRPAAINANVPGAAPHSKHISCLAIDLHDRDGALDAWCMANLAVLEELGLWLEHPAATPGWCHLQSCPPRSGNRVFEP